MKYERVEINGEYIRLDDLLKFAGISPTGGTAKRMIQAGHVKVNGEICLQRGKKMKPGDTAEYGDETVEVIVNSE